MIEEIRKLLGYTTKADFEAAMLRLRKAAAEIRAINEAAEARHAKGSP